MVAEHGKGLVDSMSGFGANTPLRMRVLQRDEFFNNSLEIVTCLKVLRTYSGTTLLKPIIVSKKKSFLPVSSFPVSNYTN